MIIYFLLFKSTLDTPPPLSLAVREAAQLMVRYFDLSLGTEYLFDPPCSLFTAENDTRHTIVELGSGTGYVSLRLAEKLLRLQNRHDVLIITDLPEVCPLIKKSLRVERNKWSTSALFPTTSNTDFIKVLPLPWGSVKGAESLSKLLSDSSPGHERRQLTHIVCSDLVRSLAFFLVLFQN